MLLELLDIFLDEVEVDENVTTYSNRQQKEVINDPDREIQQEVEDFWAEISEDLGELSRDWHELKNMAKELTGNVRDTLANHVDSLNPSRYMTFLHSNHEQLQLADHLFTYRLGYTHHGLYVGENQVIHYENGSVHHDSLENFRKTSEVFILPKGESPLRYEADLVVQRAKSRLGENNYHLIYNNCEHFVRWCRCGREP